MISIRSIGWICVICFIIGCAASEQSASSGHVPKVAQANVPNPGPAEGIRKAVTDRKLIYTSQIDVIVDDMTVAQEKMTELINSISERGGYLAQQEVSGATEFGRQASWTIRVPHTDFDRFLADIEELGELKRHTRNAQDVTEAFADLEARLRNKQSGEERLLKHLEKSGELKDTLELERELSRVRGEVEQLQGQLNLMKNKTDLATVSVSFVERDHDAPPVSQTFAMQIASTFNKSWSGLVKTGQAVVLFGVAVGPWLVAVGMLLLPLWILRRLLTRA